MIGLEENDSYLQFYPISNYFLNFSNVMDDDRIQVKLLPEVGDWFVASCELTSRLLSRSWSCSQIPYWRLARNIAFCKSYWTCILRAIWPERNSSGWWAPCLCIIILRLGWALFIICADCLWRRFKWMSRATKSNWLRKDLSRLCPLLLLNQPRDTRPY